jgi:aminobenzoyl-glutamate transport protein
MQTPNRSDESTPSDAVQRTGGPMARFLTLVEWLGNLLPHPVTLFALFALGALVLSAVASSAGLSVEDPRPGREGEMLEVTNLLSGEGIRWVGQSMVTNFSGFTPLGTVLVALLGVGVAEKSGLLTAIVRALVLNAPRPLVTLVVVFSGVVSNTASEMGYVVLIPLAMAIYHSLGRHPFAGLAAAFAGVEAGYSANILIGTVDPLLAGITEEAAQLIDPAYEVNPACQLVLHDREHLLDHRPRVGDHGVHRRAASRGLRRVADVRGRRRADGAREAGPRSSGAGCAGRA